MDKETRIRQSLGLLCIFLLIGLAPVLRSEVKAGHLYTTVEDPLWVTKASSTLQIGFGYGFGVIASFSGKVLMSVFKMQPTYRTEQDNQKRSLWQRTSTFIEWLYFSTLVIGTTCFFIFGDKTWVFSFAAFIGSSLSRLGLIPLLESSNESNEGEITK